MRRVVVSLALAVLFALPALAQNSYKAEIFGGYQYTRVNPGSGLDGVNLNGWNASATGNLNNWLGVTADFSAGYKSVSGANAHFYNFLFGPTVSYNKLDHFQAVRPHLVWRIARDGLD